MSSRGELLLNIADRIFYIDRMERSAIPIYMKAISLGNLEAHVRLADIYYDGIFVDQDYKKAFALYAKASHMGEESVSFKLAECYYNGKGIEKNYENAYRLYAKAATIGIKEAYIGLANCYYNGQGVNQNYETAFQLYAQAAQLGVQEACIILGNCYYKGRGIKRDYKEAFEWYKEAAKYGDVEGYIKLADCYYNGKGTEENHEKALELYEKAATIKIGSYYSDKSEFKEFYEALAERYQKGIDVPQDYEKAFKLYEKAASLYGVDGYISLGDAYQEGIEVPRDYEKAFKLYEKAAESSYSNKAHVKLGDCYYNGQGTTKDYEAALKCYEKAKYLSSGVHMKIGDCNYQLLKKAFSEEKINKSLVKKLITEGINAYTYREEISPLSKVNLGDLYLFKIRCGLSDTYDYETDYKNAQKAYQEAAQCVPQLAKEKIEILESIKESNKELSTWRNICFEGSGDTYCDKVLLELKGTYPKKFIKVIDNVSELPIDKIDTDLYGAIYIKPKTNNSSSAHTIYRVPDYIKCVNRLNEMLEDVEDLKKDKLNDYDIIREISKKIAKTAVYDYDVADERENSDKYTGRNMIGALLQGKTVCAGYSETLRNALALKGIQSIYVVSESHYNETKNESSRHAFLQVQTIFGWQCLDLTWDRDNFVTDRPLEYFLLPKNMFCRSPYHCPDKDMVTFDDSFSLSSNTELTEILTFTEEKEKQKTM